MYVYESNIGYVMIRRRIGPLFPIYSAQKMRHSARKKRESEDKSLLILKDKDKDVNGLSTEISELHPPHGVEFQLVLAPYFVAPPRWSRKVRANVQ